MHVALRPYATAGIALVGAGVIAATPVIATPAPPDIAVPAESTSTAPVELAALVNPIELWANAISTTMANVGKLSDIALADPAPILSAILDNQRIAADVFSTFMLQAGSGVIAQMGNVPEKLQAAVTQILAGDIYDGVTAIPTAFTAALALGALPALVHMPDIIAVLKNPSLNVASVIEAAIPALIGNVAFPGLGFVVMPAVQIGLTGQAIYDGLQAGDFEAVANAIISLPSDSVNFFLNGNNSPGIGVPGILTVPFGLAQGLLNVRQAIANAIHPPAVRSPLSVSAADVPDPGATSVTMDVQTLQAPVAVPEGTTATAEETPPAPEDPAPGGAGSEELLVKTNGATDMTDGNKAVPGQSSAHRASQRLRSTISDTADRIGQGLTEVRQGVTESVKRLSSRDTADTAASSTDGADSSGN